MLKQSFLIFALLMACSPRQNNDTNLKVLNQQAQEITQLDPQMNTSLASGLQLGKMYESLLETHPFDGPFELLPNLAKNLPTISKDGKTFLFEIRGDIFYFKNSFFKTASQTRLVTAEDFVTTFKRIADPRLISPHYSSWAKSIEGLEEWHQLQLKKEITDYTIPIVGVVALKTNSLQIKIKRADRFFLNSLTSFVTAPIPLEAINATQNILGSTYVGTGPFIVQEFVQNSKMTFVKNPDFRKKTFPPTKSSEYAEYTGRQVPLLDKIVVQVMNEAQTQWLNLLQGKLDYIEIPKDNFSSSITAENELSAELKNKGLKLSLTSSQTNIYYLGLNQRKFPTNQLKLRQAIAYAVDVEKMNKLFFNGTADIADGILPKDIPGNSPALHSPYKKNLKLARELIKDLKLKTPLQLIVRDSTLARQIGEFFQKELHEAGLEIAVEQMAWPRLLDRAQKGEYDLFYLAWFVGLPSGFQFFDIIYGKNYPGSYNRVGYQNPKLDKLYEKAELTLNENVQNLFFKEMNQIVIDDLPILPLLHAKDYFIYWKKLHNYRPSEFAGGVEQYLDIK